MRLTSLTLVLALSMLTGCAHLRGRHPTASCYPPDPSSSVAIDTTTSITVDTSWVDAQHAADLQRAADAQQQLAAQQQADQAQAAWQQSMDQTLAAQAAAIAAIP